MRLKDLPLGKYFILNNEQEEEEIDYLSVYLKVNPFDCDIPVPPGRVYGVTLESRELWLFDDDDEVTPCH